MPNTTDNVFRRVSVDFAIQGVARITWEMNHHFRARGPWTFQLQVGTTGNNDADDWRDVGEPFTNAFYATDSEPRNPGKKLTTHYRIKLTDGLDRVFISQPASVYGVLDHRSWCLAREIIRKINLRARKFVGTNGWLLKRRRLGIIPDPTDLEIAVTDPLTGDIVAPRGNRTFNTEYEEGYYDAYPMFMDLSQENHDETTDPGRGTVDDTAQYGICSAYPQIDTNDIWIAKDSDQRYYVHRITVLAQMRNVPLVVRCELRQAPTSDVIYQIEVPDE